MTEHPWPNVAGGWNGQEKMTVLRSHLARRKREDRGTSLVEFALLVPLIFSLLLGMITGGLALSTKNSSTNAVREGARLGATLPPGSDWSSDWAIAVRNRVVALAGGDLEEEEVCVEIIDVGANPNAQQGGFFGTACPTGDAPDTPASATKGCLVKVWSQTNADLNVLFFTRELALSASAVGIYERPGDCP